MYLSEKAINKLRELKFLSEYQSSSEILFSDVLEWLERKKRILASINVNLSKERNVYYYYTIIFIFDDGKAIRHGGGGSKIGTEMSLIEYLLFEVDDRRMVIAKKEKERRMKYDNSFIKRTYYTPYDENESYIKGLFS